MGLTLFGYLVCLHPCRPVLFERTFSNNETFHSCAAPIGSH